MTLTEMLGIVRRDLHDADASDYRWTDEELEQHIAHAVKDFSEALPLEQKATLATTAGSREISIAGLTGRILIEAVEYPTGRFPACYQRFSQWNDTLTLLGAGIPDGSNCYIYYGKLHTLDGAGSTIPPQHEFLLAAGACGYAAVEWGVYSVNRVNVGGAGTPQEWQNWRNEKLRFFRSELKRLGKNNRVRVKQLYTPFYPIASKTTDWGP